MSTESRRVRSGAAQQKYLKTSKINGKDLEITANLARNIKSTIFLPRFEANCELPYIYKCKVKSRINGHQRSRKFTTNYQHIKELTE